MPVRLLQVNGSPACFNTRRTTLALIYAVDIVRSTSIHIMNRSLWSSGIWFKYFCLTTAVTTEALPMHYVQYAQQLFKITIQSVEFPQFEPYSTSLIEPKKHECVTAMWHMFAFRLFHHTEFYHMRHCVKLMH